MTVLSAHLLPNNGYLVPMPAGGGSDGCRAKEVGFGARPPKREAGSINDEGPSPGGDTPYTMVDTH